jgi:NAD(P)-dependent dehydrogenase (short-subunit alcohol dehydrogenase family)
MELVPAPELRRQFDVNVLGPMAVTQAVLPLLRAAHGRIINVGAPTGWVGVPLLGPIGASKAALHLITDALRLELRHQGISVSLIVPGAMETGIFATAEAAGKAAGPSSPEAERVYTKVVQTAAEKMADMNLAPVDATVNAIHGALTARHPKAAYTIGRDARQFALVRSLPRAVRDRALMGAVGVSRETFEDQPAKVSSVAIAR